MVALAVPLLIVTRIATVIMTITDDKALKLVKDSKCPVCKGTDVNYFDMLVDFGEISQGANCMDCDSQWFEIYTLNRIERKIHS